ncbi:hypothetical protein BD410DRAFT_783665 [Rickenella mellea]|uniref:F-box domain-containing protein n=1 Tax=Rickenella mellea TaxID=50990 RepID=A0A4Y7QHL1_9AGAM|nr:hypothetical protein BD410DRAFT_783665 [Rickenella mellea]
MTTRFSDSTLFRLIPPAPMQHLVDDALCLIFSYCVTAESSANLPNPAITRAPWKLTLVCSRWRQIALLIKRLWASFEVDSCNPWLLQVWLDRSGNHPLEFVWNRPCQSICHIEHSTDHAHSVCSRAKLLCEEYTRWRSVTVMVQTSCLTQHLTNMSYDHTGVPYLESLQIEGNNSLMSRDVLFDIRYATLLKSLCLPFKTESVLMGDSVFLRLTSLISTGFMFNIGMPTDEWLSLLTRCPNVARSHIMLSDLSPTPQMCNVLELPIQDLVVGFHGAGVIQTFMDKLCLPALANLRLHQQEMGTSFTQPASYLKCFIRRSNCSLRSVRLASLDFSERSLVQCLHLMPQLEVLHLTAMDVSELFLESMSHVDADNCLSVCPRLRKIKIADVTEALQDVNVNDMIVSRWNAKGRNLRMVELESCGLEPDPIPAGIRACQLDGLEYLVWGLV